MAGRERKELALEKASCHKNEIQANEGKHRPPL
jgi:hypothetical protein